MEEATAGQRDICSILIPYIHSFKSRANKQTRVGLYRQMHPPNPCVPDPDRLNKKCMAVIKITVLDLPASILIRQQINGSDAARRVFTVSGKKKDPRSGNKMTLEGRRRGVTFRLPSGRVSIGKSSLWSDGSQLRRASRLSALRIYTWCSPNSPVEWLQRVGSAMPTYRMCGRRPGECGERSCRLVFAWDLHTPHECVLLLIDCVEPKDEAQAEFFEGDGGGGDAKGRGTACGSGWCARRGVRQVPRALAAGIRSKRV
ncbi:hypothetical protein B0T25DRAFT_51124 [Lasiosphaeria hispida]|uniref:Uncharacterized protein n=1 Tax=Lasiosphaeria hispida TaxID=260671 RepID=A0AAJ0MKD9_9PEZI|nr:hypothetical protein B0T25DRAFT_51124 [Lasiosphaeria hispida]